MPPVASKTKTLVASALLLLVAAGITAIVFSTEPTAKRGGATKQTAMLVDVTPVERGTFRPLIVATGTVEAAKDIVLRARVAGEVVERDSEFVPGGFVEKGEAVLKLDAADYYNALQQQKSELSQASAALEIEMGRQNVAEQDYRLLNGELAEESKELVLRKPQRDAAQARIEAAKAAVHQAQLNLERTTVRAPFDAQVLEQRVNLGSQVSVGDALARLAGIKTYWVAVSVPRSKLRWLEFPKPARTAKRPKDAEAAEEGQQSSRVEIHNRSAWPKGVYRVGYLDRLVGALDAQTRLARVLVTVSDPLARKPENAKLPPLMIGAYVEARIQAAEVPDVIRLNRDHIRKNDTVWVMEEGKLQIRDVEVVVRDEKYAYISKGLSENARVVTTHLSTVTEGAKLRVEASKKE